MDRSDHGTTSTDIKLCCPQSITYLFTDDSGRKSRIHDFIFMYLLCLLIQDMQTIRTQYRIEITPIRNILTRAIEIQKFDIFVRSIPVVRAHKKA